MKSSFKRIIGSAFGVFLLAVAPQIARAQVCGGTSMIGSTLQYIVRDAKGTVIDASGKEVQVAKSDSPRGWVISSKDFIGSYKGEWNIKAPDNITGLVGKLSVVKATSSPMCNFAAAQTLQLTLGGKTMRLIFLTPQLPKYQSMEFLVDSIPFQDGAFAIDLPTVPDGEPKFYEASGWKKISDADEAFIHGEAALGSRDYQKSIEYLKRADTLKPKDAHTLRYLGYDYLMTKQYSQAVTILEQVIDLTPNSALAYGHLARAYWLNGQKPQALDAYSAALRFCRRDDECDESWEREARDDLRKALAEVEANNPTPPKDADGYIHDGIIHHRAEMFDEAAARFKKATELDPKNVEAFKWLGLAYTALGRNEDVIAAGKAAVQLAPEDSVAHAMLGQAYFNLKRYKEAVDSYTMAARLNPSRKEWQTGLKKAQDAMNSPPESKPVAKAEASRGPRQFIKLDSKVLAEYVGQYQMPATESHQAFVLNVILDGDKLIGEAFGHRAEFLPYSETDFFMREEGVELRFVRDAQGKVSHIDWVGTIVKRIK
jgi:tetratricopeptide (TPR) repeat protein